jgi:NAD(P)-dependent dehydrogenase (short-subunit alcohol dehydrogenase family)
MRMGMQYPMRVILITGATDGLGRALAERLAQDGEELLVHGRDAERLARVADELAAASEGPAPRTFLADLADLAEVRRLAAEVRDATDRLDVLVSNAGIGSGEPDGRDRRTSVDGYELRFAVNFLAGFVLTLELLPLLRASAPARVVNVASLGQYPLDFDDLMLERGYDGSRAYAQSKLAQIMAGFELAARVPANEVTVNSLHPATYMPTKMVLQEVGRQIDSIEDGVAATYRLVSDPALAGVTGAFFDRTREARADDQAYDPDARAELWRRATELVGRGAAL